MKEKQLQKAIVEALNYKGCYCWVANAGLIPLTYKGKTRMIRVGQAGTSDIIGLRKDGKFIAIEVKLPKRRKMVTALQQQFIDYIKEKGGVAGVATSIKEALEVCGL